MEKKNRKSLAVKIKREKDVNCAQAVICAFTDVAGVDEVTAMSLGSGFGAGMGNGEGTCGAIVGAGIVLGLVKKDKAVAMRDMRNIMSKFQQRNGATQCKRLKGVGTGCALRSCDDCVGDAAEFLEELLLL